MTPEERLRPHSHDRLAVAVQRIDFAAAAAALRAEAHASVAGHRQVALVRRGPLSLILFAFEADGFIKEHQTDGEVTIQVLAGQLDVTVHGEVLQLGGGELVALAPKQPHAVRAIVASDMLLTVCRIPAAPESD
ncbi:cupin domain-containing protein [Gemmatimonas sp.]|uniref:cupin domain-containing protein n=1 Tax=Gemmatimonas sp. TaxID=1962908 RepID=UPI003983B5FD